MTKIRFQADADLRHAIVTGVTRRQANLDFQSANAAGLEGIKDPEVLEIAAQDNRLLMTERPYQPSLVILSCQNGVLAS
jgi:Domain of unknown function (DUF5615)